MSRLASASVLLAAVSLPLSVFALPSYNAVLLDLTSIDSNGHSINDSGYSVGFYRNADNNNQYAGYSAQGGVITLLPNVGLGGPYNKFIDVNNNNVSTGRSFTPGFQFNAFTYDGNTGVMTSLGTLGGTNSYGEAINDNGQVVGLSDVVGGGSHAFSYKDGVMTDLGTLGGNQSTAFDVNNDGVIVGKSDIVGGGERGFVHQNGVMTGLGTLAGNSQAVAINENGVIAGNSVNGAGQTRAVIFDSNGNPIDLGTLGGTYSEAFSINDSGYIVGGSFVGSGNTHGFIWHEDFGMLDLNDLIVNIDGEILYITTVWDINENGDIVGAARNLSGQSQAIYLQAVSEVPLPAAGWLFVSALAGLVARKRLVA